MPDSPQTPRRVSPGTLALFALGGLMLYILSPGPIYWLLFLTDGHSTELDEYLLPVLNGFIAPLQFAHDQFPMIQSFYKIYFSLIGLA